MQDRFSPLGIPLRLTILLLPFCLGGLVTLRVINWAQLSVEVAGAPALPHASQPLIEQELVMDVLRERVAIAASREGERRPEPVQVLPEVVPSARIDDLVPVAYRSLVLRTAARHGLDPRLLAAVIKLESRFDRTTVGTHGEVGLMQILADTGAWLARYAGMESYDLRDDETSLELGAIYLAINLREYGSVEKALAVYNGGPRAAAGWESNIYVARVLSYYRPS